MTTERMMMVAAAAMVCATCCAKEDYKDPQKFAEKYVREDIENRYPGKIYNPVLQYKGFELVNVHSEMRETLSGANSRIVCEFRVVPESGVEYYRLARDVRWFDYGHMGLVHDVGIPQLTKERIADINGKVKEFAQRRPLLVEKADITPKPDQAKDTIYVYRTRNEDGIFVPMRAAGAGSVFRYEGVGGWYNTNELFTARTVKRLGGFEASSAEGKAAHLAHSNACEAVRMKIKALNDAVAALNSVTNRHGWNQSFAETRFAELKKERVVPLETELEKAKETLSEQQNSAKRKLRDINAQEKSAGHEKKRLEDSLARLEKNRKSTEANIEKATKDLESQKRGTARNAQRQLPRLQSSLADIVKKQEEGNARLQALTAKLAELMSAKQSAQADVEKEHAATQAKIDELKAKIAEQTKAVESQVQADVSARLEKLANEIQALADELEKGL